MTAVYFSNFNSLYSSSLSSVNRAANCQQQEEIERLTKEFLAKGGEIDSSALIRRDDATSFNNHKNRKD